MEYDIHKLNDKLDSLQRVIDYKNKDIKALEAELSAVQETISDLVIMMIQQKIDLDKVEFSKN